MEKISGVNKIHSVWAYNKLNQWAILIIVYRPDPNLWIDYKARKKQHDTF
jgi:hypothetical protein